MPPGSTPFSRRATARCRPNSCCCASRPSRGSAADSLVWGKLMALAARRQLPRRIAARAAGADDLAGGSRLSLSRISEGRADHPGGDCCRSTAGCALDLLYDALPPAVGPHYASNNWVVDGTHSASGKPLLANDPHLGFGAPGFWYLARLKTPEREIAGATVAGTPLVVIGHNDQIAWGFTTTTADVEDLFIEKVDPTDPGRYLTPDGSAPFETRRETIVVRGAAPVDLTVRATRHGPVLSDVLPPGAADPGYVLALAATFLDARRPQRRGAVGGRPRHRLAELSRGLAELCRADDRTSSMPMTAARSASSRRGWCRSAARAMAGCRRRAGPANTIGAASSRSTSCPAPSTRPRAISSAPTTRSCPTAIPIF